MPDKPNSLLIKDGKVFDSESRTFVRRDVLVEGGKVVRVAASAEGTAASVIDARGKLVLPGLIDFHLHCFAYAQIWGVDVGELAPHAGTTAFVDAGSSGAVNFEAFRRFIAEPAPVKVFSFLNVSALGHQAQGVRGIENTEYDDERFLLVDAALETIEKNRERIVGVKARMCADNFSLAPLLKARDTADRAKLPIMVHVASNTVPLETILSYLREGDIVTHVYHGGADSILGADGGVRPVVLEARKRGIRFDVGFDRVHADFSVARAAFDQGFYPDFISTDLTMTNRHVVVDLPATISKLAALGLPLEEAVYRATALPARKLNRPSVSGSVAEGAPADIGIFDLAEAEIVYNDTYGNSVRAERRLVPVMTIVDGAVLEKPERTQEAPSFAAK
jgi:dihydroorotase